MSLIQDLRYAFRAVRRSPSVAGVAVLALALGIGANTAIFTVINSVLLRPLPYPDSERLLFLTRIFPNGRGPAVSIPKYFAWKQNTRDVLADVALYDIMGPGVSIAGQGEPEQIKSIHASAEYFPLFAVQPAAGRFYSLEEDRPGGPKVVVISNGLWKRRFGADPGLIGRTIVLSGEPRTVIGVAEAGFQPEPQADVWLPLQADPNSDNQGHYLLCGARLKPGVSLAAANTRMKAAGEQFRRQYPDWMGKNEAAGAVTMQDLIVGDLQPVLMIMMGAVGCVLLIACANVANLLLARAAARDKEIAIRTAVGAGRWRLVRQLLTESVLLGVLGGALGLLLGYWGLKVLLSFMPSEIPLLSGLIARSGLDVRVLLFTLALSLATGVLFGLVPALQASRPDLHSTLKEGTGRTTGSVRHLRARGLLVISEMALGLVLLIGAGLLIRSAIFMRAVRPGFDIASVLTFKTALTNPKYVKTAALSQYTRQLVERLERLPGVQAAGNIINLPTEQGPDLLFQIEPAKPGENRLDEQWRFASPNAFKALGIPLLRGRFFAETDVEGAPAVMIVNEAFGRKYWPKKDALGQRITVGKGLGPQFEDRTREIVGVVGSVREFGLDREPPPIMYVPQAQVGDAMMAFGSQILPTSFVVRTAGDPLALLPHVRREAVSVDSQQAVFDFRSMEQVMGKALATRRFVLALLGIFAGVALLLATIGIYGVMSYDVEQRTHEIGIRVALGAQRQNVVAMVVRHGMTLAGIGVALGLAAAFGVMRVLRAQLVGVQATDPVTFAVVAAALAAVALVATWIPARRASRVDPIVALRYRYQ